MKKIIATLLIATLLFTLTACGSQDGINASSTAEDIMQKAVELNQEVDSLEAALEGKMVMSSMGTSFTTDITMDMVCFNDPEKVMMNMSMSMLGQKTFINSYVEQTDNGYEMYLEDPYAGGWTKQVLTAEQYDESSSTLASDAAAYIENMSDLTKDGKEKLDDINTVKVSGSLSGDYINNVMNATNMTETYDELFGAEGFAPEFKGKIPITAWIEIRTGYIVRMDMDVTEVMQNYMSDVMSTMMEMYEETDLSSEEFEINVEEYTMSITYSNHNNAETFEIPAEALAAE